MWFPFFFFFFTFDDFILILYNSNITCDSSFLTLGGFLTFFSYLTVPSSHCAVPISHLTIILSYIVVPLFIYFLKFDGSIVILSSSNIASVLFLLHVTVFLSHVSHVTVFFITFGGSLTFFSHLTAPSSHCAVPISHVIVLFSHLVVPLLFFSHLTV